MPKTTQDAKLFLEEVFPYLDSTQWKRTRKYKNSSGHWVRDFKHQAGKEISLAEVSDEFVLVSQTISSSLFSKEELDGARGILDGFRAYSDSDEDEEDNLDDMSESDLRLKFGHALPGILSFYFPENTYDNPLPGDVSPDMPSEGYCFTFYETDKGPEDGFNYTYHFLVPSHCLPSIDRFNNEIFQIEPGQGTIAQFIENMKARGFTHDEDECVIGPQVSTLPSLPFTSYTPNFALLSQAMEVIARDDAKALSSLLGEGLSFRHRLGDDRTLLAFAMDKSALACFELMLADIDELPKDVLSHAFARVHDETCSAARYFLPLLASPWSCNYDASDGMGSYLVETAVIHALNPSCKAISMAMLEAASHRGTFEQFAPKLINEVAQHPKSMENMGVKRLVDDVLTRAPNILVDEKTSPFSKMIAHRYYRLAGDWMIERNVPVSLVMVEGQPIIEFLKQQLADALESERQEKRGCGGGFRILMRGVGGNVISTGPHYAAEKLEIPGLINRLMRASWKLSG